MGRAGHSSAAFVPPSGGGPSAFDASVAVQAIALATPAFTANAAASVSKISSMTVVVAVVRLGSKIISLLDFAP